MHTLRELELICQKPNWREQGSWLARRFARPIALNITWLIGRWPISANAVTASSLVVGLAAAVLIAVPGCFPLGVAVLWAWYLLDHVDGQVARLRGSQSVTGIYFDFMMHHMVHPAVAFAMGYGLAVATGHLYWTLAGAAFALGTMALSLTNDCKYKAFYGAAAQPVTESNRPTDTAAAARVESSPFKRNAQVETIIRTARAVHRFLLIACEMPNVILILTGLALSCAADAYAGGVAVRVYVLVMAVLAPGLALLRLTKQVWTRAPDAEYRAMWGL
jgi:hypothetical protein